MLEYCPKPSTPLTTTLKRYAIPTTILLSASIFLFSLFFLFPGAPSPSAPVPQALLPPPLPTVTGEYDPGVSVGDYVTMGNFACNINHQMEGVCCINDLAFRKLEVIEVSGKEVTLLCTEQYKNGSATPYSGHTETWDVEIFFWSSDTPVEEWVHYGVITSANLTEGCLVHSRPCGLDVEEPHMLAKTEVRTYLGVKRNVNLLILNTRDDWPVYNDGIEINVTDIIVYDVESGFSLEHKYSTVDGDLISAASIIDTNIFSSPSPSPISALSQENTDLITSTDATYATAGLFVILIAVVAAVTFRKRKTKGGEKLDEKKANHRN